MRNIQWQNKIIVPKDIDTSDPSDATTYKLCMFFKRELIALKEKGVFEVLEDLEQSLVDEIIDQFDFIAFIAMSDYETRAEYEFEEEQLYEHFNFNLNQLYDIGNINKLIWIEMPM